MARKINAMHQLFGRYSGTEPRTCSECSNFRRYRYQGTNYKKCEAYGETHSEATDWNVSFEACGHFNKPYNGTSVIDILKHSKKAKQDEGLKEQLSMSDWLGGD